MPKVTVIVPVHNAGEYLTQCLDSLLGQTLQDIELICVDDESTDGSLEVLQGMAERDARLKVLAQSRKGAGAARNLGIEHATGEYLVFLDADDFFEPAMLEKVSAKCDADNADIGLWGARHYDTRTDTYRPTRWLLRTALVPEKLPFTHRDTEHIFGITSPAPWTKMFRSSFVAVNGLRFQELKRTNDLYFTRLALILAERITVVDEVFTTYRIGGASNLQSTNHEAPLEFHRALVAVKDELVRRGLFDAVERSFANDALSSCLYNLSTLRDPIAYCALYDRLRFAYFAEFGIAGRPAEEFYLEHQYQASLKILKMPPEIYLLEEAKTLRRELDEVRSGLQDAVRARKNAESKLKKANRSLSYRILRRLVPARVDGAVGQREGRA